MTKERRQYPRAGIEFNIAVETPGAPWVGRAMNLSPVGIKIAPIRQPLLLPPGSNVQIRFPTRDGEPALSLPATLQRADPDGIAFSFGNLEAQQFKRLKSLVDSDLQREWQELLQQIEGRLSPAAAGGRSGGSDKSELARWEALLTRLGFDSLQLPSDGTLSRQWQDFLNRLEAEKADKARKPPPR